MIPENKKSPFTKEQNLISLLFSKYLPFWPLFVALLILSLAGAYAYLQYATPVYETSATLIIKDEKKGVDDSRIMESMDAFASNKIVENEIEVIQSRGLVKEVVNQLSLYAQVHKDEGIKSSYAYTSSPIKIEHQNPDAIAIGKTKPQKIFFSFDSAKGEVKLENKAYPLNQWVETPYGKLRFSQNDKLATKPEGPLYFTLINPKKITEDLLKNLEVSAASKLSSVVNLTLKDPVPQRGEDILNGLLLAYTSAAVSERDTLAANTMAFIENRIKFVEKDLEEVESKIQKYKSNEGVVDLSEQGKLYLQKVGDSDSRIADIRMQLSVLDKVERYVISKNAAAGLVPSTLGINDAILSQLLERLYDAEMEYERLRKTNAENHPILLSVADEIEKIRPGILENIRSQRTNLQANLRNLSSTTGRYSSALQTIPQKERELIEISREKAIKDDLYSLLLQKREETALSYAPTTGESKVVDLAESSIRPVSPKTPIIYAFAVMFALAMGVGLITGKELLNNKVLFRAEIEGLTNVPVIGELSQAKQTKLLSDNNEQEAVREQFRDLRVGLRLYGTSGLKKKILVTSSIEGEGKSFVCENLALSLATSGKKVVLINFDLRKSSASAIFDVEEPIGIADYLLGNLAPYEIIKPTEHANLSVIPAGEVNPSTFNALLDADLNEFFAYLEYEYDYVIIDTPPVSIATDAYLLSNYCDTTLFVVRHKYTPKQVLEYLELNTKINELKNLVIVFNGVKNRGMIKSNYGHNYGYEQKGHYKNPQIKYIKNH